MGIFIMDILQIQTDGRLSLDKQQLQINDGLEVDGQIIDI